MNKRLPLLRLVALLLLLVSVLSLHANDGRDKAPLIYWWNGVYIFEHDGVEHENGFQYVVTYMDTTDNPYLGNIVIPYESWSHEIDEIGDCAFKDCDLVTSVDLGSGILRIDSCSFQNCTSMTSVVIRTPIKYIGERAFQNCYSLQSIKLPVQLTTLGNRAFRSCKSLKNITIPPNLTRIEEKTFMGCSSLDTVIINHALPIGYNAFADCGSLKAIIINSFTPPVVDQDLGLTPEQKAAVKVIVPKMALEAYRHAPYWKDLAGLETRTYDFEVNNIYYNIIADDEVCITYRDTTYNSYQGTYSEEEYDWFVNNYRTEYWRGMGIEGKVTYVGKTYFVTAIGENAFRDCTSLNMLEWGNHNKIKHIGANAFKGCSNLKSVDLPCNLQTIGAHAFEGCSFIHVIGIPSTVNLIDTCAFMGCSRLKYVDLASPMQIGPQAFSGTNLRGHTLTGGIAIECSSATPPMLADSTVFDSTHYANSVVKVLYSLGGLFRADENWNRFVNIRRLPYDFKAKDNNNYDIWYRINNENEVGVSPDNEVLYGTYGYGARDIPENVNYQGHSYRVTSIENRAFYFSQTTKVTVPNSVKRIGDLAFGKSNVEEVILGDSVETIGYGAFNETPWLRKLHFPKTVKEIGDSALFNTTELYGIMVDKDNPFYDSREDCNALIETATNRLIAGGANCTEIPSSVTAITDYAFYGKKHLGRISIPGSICRVGTGAFVYCDNLYQVTFSEPTKCIGAVAFAFTALTSVVIPNSVDTIEEGAFVLCQRLKKITLGTGLRYLGGQAFGVGNGGTSVIDTVVCYAAAPPRMGAANCFSGAYNRATLLVPQTSLELYKNDPNWSKFYKIVAIESSGIEEISGDEAPKQRYNLQGLPVGDDYRGIVIENSKKILIE